MQGRIKPCIAGQAKGIVGRGVCFAAGDDAQRENALPVGVAAMPGCAGTVRSSAFAADIPQKSGKKNWLAYPERVGGLKRHWRRRNPVATDKSTSATSADAMPCSTFAALSFGYSRRIASRRPDAWDLRSFATISENFCEY